MDKKLCYKCHVCDYKIYSDSELTDKDCPLCGGVMVYQSQTTLNPQDKEKIQTESEALDEVLDNQLVNSMISELEQFGEDKIWEQINHSDTDIQLSMIPIFIEAKHKLQLN
jgi:predicted RNA-binding Zn-ribbon protein involved in translation (DUF1610 family)